MKMRDLMTLVEESNDSVPFEPLFYLREIERGDGSWVWQYGSNTTGRRISWFAGTFKTATGAEVSATRQFMNPNQKNGLTGEFFKNPIIADRLPITDKQNPFCMD